MPHIPKLFFKSPNIAYHVVSRTALDGFVLWINKKRVLVCPPLLPDLLGGVLGAIVGFLCLIIGALIIRGLYYIFVFAVGGLIYVIGLIIIWWEGREERKNKKFKLP